MDMGVTWRLGIDAALGLANTIHGPGGHYRRRTRPGDPDHDHLATPAEARAFLGGHAVPVPARAPTAAQLGRLRAIRASVRALGDEPDIDLDAWRGPVEAALTRVTFRIAADHRLRSTARGWDGVADDLLPAALALAEVSGRLRSCANPRCRFRFIDRSRNGTRVWCEAAVCGNRVRVGRHRLADR